MIIGNIFNKETEFLVADLKLALLKNVLLTNNTISNETDGNLLDC